MSELKVHVKPLKTNVLGQTIVGQSYYLKSEADKVIAELEESHKMEVKQLLMEIVELKKAIAHHNHKRCMAMARIAQDDWHLHNSFYAMGHQEFEKRKCEFYEKWHKRWLELAEKFKEGK